MEANLVALVKEQSTQKIKIPQPRTKKHKRRPVNHIKIIQHSQEIDKLKEQGTRR